MAYQEPPFWLCVLFVVVAALSPLIYFADRVLHWLLVAYYYLTGTI